ncbi:phosphoribosyltransferase [Candidatus Thiothrix sp. Deng01]|uniref:Hypoxanthine phosphoribosyltransferase n=2 Tax=Thiothrix TaxID=1030 RepID=A0A7L6AN53_9GAMM|nr:phosphoribosyltransferase [Candidatus Thiothrix sp. Deng01]MEB4591035.1 phosphoribosyltransferase [Candidatus Thiothrix sp. Deng01]QLQ30500.1 MAG: hypoxanthine phosphoribosyltransferase [Candidatus Thiothrix singaporensis]
MEKTYIDENSLILDAFRLGVQVFEDGFRPSFIVGLWRGGSTVGIYVQECLQTLGVRSDHIALRTSYRGLPYYQDMLDAPETEIRVHGTQYLLESLNADDQLLLVDDVFSSGRNLDAVLKKLRKNLKRNMPEQVKIATIWQRPSYLRVGFTPDYSLYSTEDWLVLPYEMCGLTLKEIRLHKPFLLPYL